MSSTALAPITQAASLVSTAANKGSGAITTTTTSSSPAVATTPQSKRTHLNLTPQKASSSPQTLRTPQSQQRESGRWLHPRMDEVIKRRNATNFDNSNIKAIGINAGCIITSLVLHNFSKRA
jgi:nucleoporin POM34